MLRQQIKKLGPGLLWAAAAIGVSHLVQSTTAGAQYGFLLLGVVIFANIIKYPFFEYGLRYTIATQNNLLVGYKQLGRWALPLFFLLTLGTMFTVVAAVVVVTAGLIPHLLNSYNIPLEYWIIALLAVCSAILLIGKYTLLDHLIKIIVSLLALATLVTVLLAVTRYTPGNISAQWTWHERDIFFLIALLGWMPCPIDASVWHSIWTQAKARQLGHYLNLSQARFDFNIGYIGTTLLAVCFLAMGALVLQHSATPLSTDSLTFAEQLIAIYTATLGPWSYPLITFVAFITMFSTTLTVLDATPRVLAETCDLLFGMTYPRLYPINLKMRGLWRRHFCSHQALKSPLISAILARFKRLMRAKRARQKLAFPSLLGILYWLWFIIIVSGGLAIIFLLTNNMRTLVTIATTLSFLSAPVLGLMNYYLATHEQVPKNQQPGRLNRLFAIFGLICLSALGLWYILLWFI